MFFTENYNSPGSTYWACKGFLPLAVPADHPFWTSPEEPYPQTLLTKTVSLDHPSHILTHGGGHTLLLSSGQACHYPLRHGAEKYGKLAYSAAFGYSVPTGAVGLDMWNPDSTIALSEDGGERWVVRRDVKVNDPDRNSGGFLEGVVETSVAESESSSGWLRAVWRPWKGTSVETWLIPPHPSTPAWHIRIHRIKRDAVRVGGEKVLVSDAGFAIYSQDVDGRTLSLVSGDADAAALEGRYGKLEGVDASVGGGAYAVVRSAAGVSGIIDLTAAFFPSSTNLATPSKSVTNTSNYSSLSTTQAGQELKTRRGQIVHLDSNANIVSSRSCMPALIGEYGSDETAAGGEDIWLATGIFAMPSKASVLGAERKEAQSEGMDLQWAGAWQKKPDLASLPAPLTQAWPA